MRNEDPYFQLVGAIIRQAVDDYLALKAYRAKKIKYHTRGIVNLIRNYGTEAETWLFGKGLSEFLRRTGMDNIINADYIRQKAKSIKQPIRRIL